jgi:glutamate racemase
VFAEVYEKLKQISLSKPVELIFANALPETGKGYNRMPDVNDRIKIFNNALNGFNESYDPEIICIACNTLSVLVDKTDFYKYNKQKIVDIVTTGIQSINTDIKNDPQARIVLFGTETTIESDAHRQLLLDQGYFVDSIITQDCPYLASEIEFDYQSEKTKNIVSKSVNNAITQLRENQELKIYTFLACTHYGYVADYFLDSFRNNGFSDCSIINPNQSMVDYIFKYVIKNTDTGLSSTEAIQCRVVSRCEILPEEIASISKLISPISKDTVETLKNYELDEDLFNL